jgi:hypothetical protein
MNNSELDPLLRRAAVPERDADYWEDFPKSVTHRLANARSAGLSQAPGRRFPRLAWGLGFATACIVLGFAIGFWRGRDTTGADKELAAMQKCFQEIALLFPNQVRAIVLDEHGLRLILADAAEVPSSAPVYVKICQPRGCLQFITFSGQQIQVNGDLCDVLTDAHGHILIAGQKLVWTSAQPAAVKTSYRIQARTLETRS